MLLSEEEAKARWCPFTKRGSSYVAGVCLASGCMAWEKVSIPGGHEQLGQCELIKKGVK
jgi:hypothetical protein